MTDRPNTPKEQAELKRHLDAAMAAPRSHVDGCGATQPHPNRSEWMGQCTCGLDDYRSSLAVGRAIHAPAPPPDQATQPEEP